MAASNCCQGKGHVGEKQEYENLSSWVVLTRQHPLAVWDKNNKL